MRVATLALLLSLPAAGAIAAEAEKPLPSVASHTQGLERREGFLPV
jgi:hypothetical protein